MRIIGWTIERVLLASAVRKGITASTSPHIIVRIRILYRYHMLRMEI